YGRDPTPDILRSSLLSPVNRAGEPRRSRSAAGLPWDLRRAPLSHFGAPITRRRRAACPPLAALTGSGKAQQSAPSDLARKDRGSPEAPCPGRVRGAATGRQHLTKMRQEGRRIRERSAYH